MEDWRNGGFGLYIHWPFCQAKCPYCDFNSHVATKIDQKRWKNAYLAEIERSAALTDGRVLETVFFGGGTPSLMDGDLVAEILQKVRESWPMVNDPEITLEANPGSVEAERFRAFRDSGVNRLSLGIQALDDASLRKLGRMHSVADALQAYQLARDLFPRVSFDLIYSRQGQSLEDWRRELTLALSLKPDHLSLYQLTIEEDTVFGKRHAMGKLPGLPDDELSADQFQLTQEMCLVKGLLAYEVSNHATEGQEARHNQIYWRGGDYVGIGPGAHGRLTLDGVRWATETARAPGQWLAAAESTQGALRREALTSEDHAKEYLLMSLRLSEGTNLSRYADLSGRMPEARTLSSLVDLGHVSVENGYLRATASGRMLLNSVIRALM